jgi:hypothetical protein
MRRIAVRHDPFMGIHIAFMLFQRSFDQERWLTFTLEVVWVVFLGENQLCSF